MIDVHSLDPRRLLALTAVAEDGTFGRAAARLGYSQSAVSQQIAALEQALGGPVFDRPGGPKPVELTPLGDVVVEQARRVLATMSDAADEIDRFQAGDAGRLAVGTFQSASTALLPGIVAAMRAAAPGVQIELRESDDDDELFDGLLDGTLDVSFVVGDLPDELEARTLLSDPWVLIAPAGTFPSGPVRPEDFGSMPQIGMPLASSCQRLSESALRAAGADPRYVFRTADNGAVAAMVRAGMGVAVMPRLCIDPSDRSVDLHEIDPPFRSRSILLAWRRNKALPPSAQRFVEFAVDVAPEVARLAMAGAPVVVPDRDGDTDD